MNPLRWIDKRLGRLVADVPRIGDRIQTSDGWGRRQGTVVEGPDDWHRVWVRMDEDGKEMLDWDRRAADGQRFFNVGEFIVIERAPPSSNEPIG